MSIKDSKEVWKWVLLTLAAPLIALVSFTAYNSQRLYKTHRCLQGADHWYACFQDRQNVEFTTDYYGFKYQGNTRDVIDSFTLYYGAWDKPILHFLKDVMQSIYANQGVFLDVQGLHCRFLSRYVTVIHAFELPTCSCKVSTADRDKQDYEYRNPPGWVGRPRCDATVLQTS